MFEFVRRIRISSVETTNENGKYMIAAVTGNHTTSGKGVKIDRTAAGKARLRKRVGRATIFNALKVATVLSTQVSRNT